MRAVDKAIEILKKTNDGADLFAMDLKMLEWAVNGFLSDEGLKHFNKVYEEVMSGTYKIPWFHDIEHLTIDQEGYVYWKGEKVEHYSPGWCWSKDAKKQAMKLARRCEHLEKLGVEINTAAVIWRWEEYKNEEI